MREATTLREMYPSVPEANLRHFYGVAMEPVDWRYLAHLERLNAPRDDSLFQFASGIVTDQAREIRKLMGHEKGD